MATTIAEIPPVKAALSAARIGTYEVAAGIIDPATGIADPTNTQALELYAWNALVSGALLMPLHVCEVVVRNAVSEALEAKYGANWPWDTGFELSLPNPTVGYNPRRDLQTARKGVPTTGKVIPELKFVFWQKLFTARYDKRLWDSHLPTVLPHIGVGATLTVAKARQRIYDDLEKIRKLRNRIAHHEPVIARNLQDDFQRIDELIRFRCHDTAGWMRNNQQAVTLIAARP